MFSSALPAHAAPSHLSMSYGVRLYKRRTAAFFSMIGLDLASHGRVFLKFTLRSGCLALRQTSAAAYIMSRSQVINFAFGLWPGTTAFMKRVTALSCYAWLPPRLAWPWLSCVKPRSSSGRNRRFRYTWRTLPTCGHACSTAARLQKLMDRLCFQTCASSRAHCRQHCRIALGVLLVVFTVGLAHGLLRERGKREATSARKYEGGVGRDRPQRRTDFSIPVAHAANSPYRRRAHGRAHRPDPR